MQFVVSASQAAGLCEAYVDRAERRSEAELPKPPVDSSTNGKKRRWGCSS